MILAWLCLFIVTQSGWNHQKIVICWYDHRHSWYDVNMSYSTQGWPKVALIGALLEIIWAPNKNYVQTMRTWFTLHAYHFIMYPAPAYMNVGNFWSHFLSRNITLWCVLTFPVALMGDIATIGQPCHCLKQTPRMARPSPGPTATGTQPGIICGNACTVPAAVP